MMHHLVEKAFKGLYPDKDMDFDSRIVYSRAFKGYNAKVVYTKKEKVFRLSHAWKTVSDDIKIGLLQSLFNKVYGTNVKTIEQDFYDIFIKKIPTYTQKSKSDPVLEESFERVNKEYLNDLMLVPNLVWGNNNFHTLGTYDYGTDTIRISKILKKDPILLDYVMYHEMLHKKFKFKKTAKKTIHHSTEFRRWERRFHDPEVEDKLKRFLKKERLKDQFWFL